MCVPVAQGGRKDWENIVTCCVDLQSPQGRPHTGRSGYAPAAGAEAPPFGACHYESPLGCGTHRTAGATISTGTPSSTTPRARAPACPSSSGSASSLTPARTPIRRSPAGTARHVPVSRRRGPASTRHRGRAHHHHRHRPPDRRRAAQRCSSAASPPASSLRRRPASGRSFRPESPIASNVPVCGRRDRR